MEANTHNPYEWIKKKIEYWKAKSREASEAADMEAFDHAERQNKILAKKPSIFRRLLFNHHDILPVHP
ncbi:TPA: hypothetical protein ACU8BD_000981 [Neisseria subflava]